MANDNDNVGGIPNTATPNTQIDAPSSRNLEDFFDISKQPMSDRQVTEALRAIMEYMSTDEFRDAYDEYARDQATLDRHATRLNISRDALLKGLELDMPLEKYQLLQWALHSGEEYWDALQEDIESPEFAKDYVELQEQSRVVEADIPLPVSNAQLLISHLFKPSSFESGREIEDKTNSLIAGHVSRFASGDELIEQFFEFAKDLNNPKASREFASLPAYRNNINKFGIENEFPDQESLDEFKQLRDDTCAAIFKASKHVKYKSGPDLKLDDTLNTDGIDPDTIVPRDGGKGSER